MEITMTKSEDRRWELIFKEVNQILSPEEKSELVVLQQEVWKTTKLYNYRKLKPGELANEEY